MYVDWPFAFLLPALSLPACSHNSCALVPIPACSQPYPATYLPAITPQVVDGACDLGLMQMKSKQANPLTEANLEEVIVAYRTAWCLAANEVVEFFYIIVDDADDTFNTLAGPTFANTSAPQHDATAWRVVADRLKVNLWVARHVDRKPSHKRKR
jgi:hypothetical protein